MIMLSFTLEAGNDSVASPSGFLVLGQQPRHTACDRCRSQKVKCLKADSDSISACQRCQRAGADCAQTSTGRIGRPTTYNKRGKKLARRRSATESEYETLGPSTSTTLKDMGSLQESAAETEVESQAEENDHEHSSSTEGQDYDIERDDAFWRSSITAFDPQLSAHSEKHDPLDFLENPGSLDYDLLDFEMCTAVELSPIAIDSSVPGPLQLCSLGSLNGTSTTTAQVGPSHAQAANTGLIPALGTQNQDSKSRGRSKVSKPTVQDLFLLIISLEDLMEKTSHDPVRDPSGPLQLQDCHIDEILRTTQTFLDIIGAYSPPQEPITTPASPSNLSQNRLSGDDAPRPPHMPDIHTYLIIVSCYTRLLKVHSNLIYYIHERVQYGDDHHHPMPTSSSSSSSASAAAFPRAQVCTLPSLQLGTTTIQDDVSLQAMLIVRVGARMIQRVEDVMGAMLSQAAGADGQAGTHHLGRSSTTPHMHHFRSSSSPTASRQQTGDGFGGRGQRGAGGQVNHMKSIVDSAIGQEDRESLARGQSGIGSLEKTIEALEKLLR